MTAGVLCACYEAEELRKTIEGLKTERDRLQRLVPHNVALCSGDPKALGFVDVRISARHALVASGVQL